MRRYKCKSCKIKKIDLALQFYSEILRIIIDNDHIKEAGGNGKKVHWYLTFLKEKEILRTFEVKLVKLLNQSSEQNLQR